MLKTVIRSKNEEDLRDLQKSICLATENAIGIGKDAGVMVSPLIKKDEEEKFFSVAVGPAGDDVILDTNLEDVYISYSGDDDTATVEE